MNGDIVIPVSKGKLVLLLAGALAFVALGIWMVNDPPVLNNPKYRNKYVIMAMGYLSIAFFGLCAYFIAKKLPQKEPGLVIGQNGFTDQSGAMAVGWVPWVDVEDISIFTIQGQKHIMVQVRNPSTYLNRAAGYKRKMMEINDRTYGTPIAITANGLQVSFDELFGLMKDALVRYRQGGHTG
jgi:hypothetical protein